MANIKLNNVLSPKDLVEFDLYTVKDSTMVDTKIDIKNLEASEDLINFILRSQTWRGYSYIHNGKRLIGYGLDKGLTSKGLLETEAFSYFIENLKAKERLFKKALPLSFISQTNYDALLSLFYHTGTIETIGTPSRKFKINQYILDEEWQYIASALILTNDDRIIRQSEAKIMMLADYGTNKSRAIIRSQGIQNIRTAYPNGFIDTNALQQAEYVYFKETNRFLPLMTQSRKRQVVSDSKLTT